MRESKARILMACRGVDARRLLRSASEAELESAVLVGDDDDGAVWPADFDYTMFLLAARPTASDIVGLALDAGCDLIHPGWGPLVRQSELAGRAQVVGLKLVGPTLAHLQLAADGGKVRDLAAELDIPVVPGSDPIEEMTDAERWLSLVGYPASARPLEDIDAPWRGLPDAEQGRVVLEGMLARGPVVLERSVQGAREIEVLVVGQPNGEALTLGERDTSVRIGGQRVLVEAPAVNLVDEEAFNFRHAAAMLISRLRWPGLVSVRFLLTPDGRAYLLRLRPGLQPWHAVTEEILGIDLVDAQIRIALGEPLGWQPHHFSEDGHAICLRLVSTSARKQRLLRRDLPADVRILPGFEVGDVVAPGEEIAQLVAHAPTRQAALVRARAALSQVFIDGVDTNLGQLKAVFDRKAFWGRPLDRDQFES